MIALALETGTPFNSFLILGMSLQNRLYSVFFDETSGLGAFHLEDLTHTLSAFRMKMYLSPFPPVSSQSVLRKFWMFISDIFVINKNT